MSDRPPAPTLPGRACVLGIVAFAAVALAGCGGSSSSSSSAASGSPSTPAVASSSSAATTSSGVNPNGRETLPPGDIPDTVAYVPYTSKPLGLTISVPEGWSRASTRTQVTFTDKLNQVQVFTAPAKGPITPASVRGHELSSIQSSVKTFQLGSITSVARPAGPAVRITYLGDSQPNPVTGKVGTLAFERYDFSHHGREVVILLSSPKGSDNVDPWRKVTSSLKLTG
jgi:hypothetical protein